MSIMLTIQSALASALSKQGAGSDVVPHLDHPAHTAHGDWATNAALALGSRSGVSPREAAEGLKGELEKDASLKGVVSRIEIAGPGFLNFFVDPEVLQAELRAIHIQGEEYGRSLVGEGKKVLVEYSSPNTNKPLHLGHLRNNFLGMALGNLMKSQGYDVVMTEIVNDRGMGVSKSMLAYMKWGAGATPESEGKKGDHMVGDFYVKYGEEAKKDDSLEGQAAELLQKWEAGDEEVRAVWEKMKQWTEDGYAVTYEKIGSYFDTREYESNIYTQGKEIILKALEEGKAEKIEGGAVAVDLTEQKLGGREDGKKVLIKSDGTAMYITQDLYLAVSRWEEYKAEKVFYVVGDEQLYHFKVLFTILELFGYEWVRDRYHHVSYGHVSLPSGKMKSREGTVVDADDMVAQVEELARGEIKKRDESLSGSELDGRAEKVALAAIKYFILKVDATSGMLYDPNASLDFEGDTGPYLQYTYARLSSILAKVGDEGGSFEGCEMTEEERVILVALSRFPDVLAQASEEMKPHVLAGYIFSLGQLTNSWYAHESVIKADEGARAFRVALVRGVRTVLGRGLQILGIDIMEKM